MSATDRLVTGVLLTLGLGLWIVAGKWLVWVVAVVCGLMVLVCLIEWLRVLLGVRLPTVPRWRV